MKIITILLFFTLICVVLSLYVFFLAGRQEDKSLAQKLRRMEGEIDYIKTRPRSLERYQQQQLFQPLHPFRYIGDGKISNGNKLNNSNGKTGNF